jgi:hypothetical protein
MTFFRIVFVVASIAAIAGAARMDYFGAGQESTDLDKSVRSGSAGRVVGVGGRIK